MTSDTLVRKIAEVSKNPMTEVRKFMNSAEEAVIQLLSEGEEITIAGLHLKIQERKGREVECKLPVAKGVVYVVPTQNVLKVKPSSELRNIFKQKAERKG